MSRIDKHRSPLATTLWSLTAGALPMIVGVSLTLSLADESLRKENLRVGAAAVEQVDRLLSAALVTTETLGPLVGQRCDRALPVMRQQVAQNPWLRSATLLYKGEPYCDSVTGRASAPPPVSREPVLLDNQSLALLGPDNLHNDFGALTLRNSGEAFGINVTLDNRLVVDRLDLVSGTTDVALHVSGVYLWDDGSLLRGELRQNPRYRTSTPSMRFDYAMHSSVSAEYVLDSLVEQLITVLGALTMVSIFTGWLCHWLLTRHRKTT